MSNIRNLQQYLDDNMIEIVEEKSYGFLIRNFPSISGFKSELDAMIAAKRINSACDNGAFADPQFDPNHFGAFGGLTNDEIREKLIEKQTEKRLEHNIDNDEAE